MTLVEFKSVEKSYPRRVGPRTEQHTVASNASFTIEAGETLPLVRTRQRASRMERGSLVEKKGGAEALSADPREPYKLQILAATPELPSGAA